MAVTDLHLISLWVPYNGKDLWCECKGSLITMPIEMFETLLHITDIYLCLIVNARVVGSILTRENELFIHFLVKQGKF